MFGHTTNNCVHFRELTKKDVKQGCIKFAYKGKEMLVDKDSFPED